jgi:hypothetical protein
VPYTDNHESIHRSAAVSAHLHGMADLLLFAQNATASLLGSVLTDPERTHAQTVAATIDGALRSLRDLSTELSLDHAPVPPREKTMKIA